LAAIGAGAGSTTSGSGSTGSTIGFSGSVGSGLGSGFLGGT